MNERELQVKFGIPNDVMQEIIEIRNTHDPDRPLVEAVFQRKLGLLTNTHDVEGLRRCLRDNSELACTAKLSTGKIRIIDYTLSSILTHIHDDDFAYYLLCVMLDFGANPNASNYIQSQSGWLPAAAGRGLRFAKLFVEHGARINHDLFGKPACWPMISAVCSGKLEIVQYLVEQGAIVNFVNIHGMSPLDYAATDERREIRDYLLSLGAKPGAELPKDHLPQRDVHEPQHPTHESLIEHIQYYITGYKFDHGEQITTVELPAALKNDFPPLEIIRFPQWNDGCVAYVTHGLSNYTLPECDDEDHPIRHAELVLLLVDDMKRNDHQQLPAPYHWALEWLCRLARWPVVNNEAYRAVNIIANGDPPAPFGEDTELVAWLLRKHYDPEPGYLWRRPDGKEVHLLMTAALFPEERLYELQHGLDKFLAMIDADESYLYATWSDRYRKTRSQDDQ